MELFSGKAACDSLGEVIKKDGVSKPDIEAAQKELEAKAQGCAKRVYEQASQSAEAPQAAQAAGADTAQASSPQASQYQIGIRWPHHS